MTLATWVLAAEAVRGDRGIKRPGGKRAGQADGQLGGGVDRNRLHGAELCVPE